MPDKKFFLQSSPHFKDRDSVPKIMYAVVVALVPAVIASLYFFRFRAVILLLSCVFACVATEALFLWVRKRPFHSLYDGSAVITGILLALTLPPSLSLELAIIGAVVAIAMKAQHRLYKKFWKLDERKHRHVAITAVARELTGFVWAILKAVPQN